MFAEPQKQHARQSIHWGRRLEQVDRPGTTCANRQGASPPIRAAKKGGTNEKAASTVRCRLRLSSQWFKRLSNPVTLYGRDEGSIARDGGERGRWAGAGVARTKRVGKALSGSDWRGREIRGFRSPMDGYAAFSAS